MVYIVCHSGSVEFDHAAIIQTHCMYLVDHLRLDLDRLVQYDVISCDERQLVEVEASSEARSYLLLKQLLVGRSSCEAESVENRFDKFRRYLISTGQTQVFIDITTGRFAFVFLYFSP